MSKVSVWDHIVDAWEGRERKDVLILVIDQIMGEHRPKTYRNISDFFGLQQPVCARSRLRRRDHRPHGVSDFTLKIDGCATYKRKFGSRVWRRFLAAVRPRYAPFDATHQHDAALMNLIFRLRYRVGNSKALRAKAQAVWALKVCHTDASVRKKILFFRSLNFSALRIPGQAQDRPRVVPRLGGHNHGPTK